MPRKPKIEAVFSTPRNRWKVDVSAEKSETGKRYKAWFKTRDEARDYAAKLNEQDAPSPAIPPGLAADADKARGILEPWNLDIVQAAREVAAALEALGDAGSILEAAREVAAALEALGDAGSILEAAKAYRASHDARSSSKPLGEAVALYMDARTDLRDATRKSYAYTLEKVMAPLAGKTLADITTADIEAVLKDKGATARKMHRRNLGAFWKWASITPRKWADLATVQDIEAPRVSNDADIEILTPAEVKALLQAAEAESPTVAAAFAIAIFAGVRRSTKDGELTKLTWGDVREDHIEIGKAIAKKSSRRFIPICPTLRAWLDATRGDAEDTAQIVPPNWEDVDKSVRRRAGWNVAARLLANPPKPTRGEWPINVCRHTCASVQVAIGTTLDDLTFKFGHSGGHDLLRKHYVSRLTKKDALAILAIGPNGSKISNLSAA